MEYENYLRDQAVAYRHLAETILDAIEKQEMLELAEVCEKVANDIDDHMTSG